MNRKPCHTKNQPTLVTSVFYRDSIQYFIYFSSRLYSNKIGIIKEHLYTEVYIRCNQEYKMGKKTKMKFSISLVSLIKYQVNIKIVCRKK